MDLYYIVRSGARHETDTYDCYTTHESYNSRVIQPTNYKSHESYDSPYGP